MAGQAGCLGGELFFFKDKHFKPVRFEGTTTITELCDVDKIRNIDERRPIIFLFSIMTNE